MKWVVDASVVAKWIAPEPDSPLAEALLDDELIVPDLLFAEVANMAGMWLALGSPRSVQQHRDKA